MLKDVVFYLLLLINAMILLTPFLYPFFNVSFVHTLFSPTCHQLASRSLCWYPQELVVKSCPHRVTRAQVLKEGNVVAYKFPVCARCMAIYLGWLLGMAVQRVVKWRPPFYLYIVLILPLAVDGLMQLLTPYESTNLVRFLTGLVAGVGLGLFLFK